MENEILFKTKLEDSVIPSLNDINAGIEKTQAEFSKMCNLQPFVMLGNLLAQISGKLSVLTEISEKCFYRLDGTQNILLDGMERADKNTDRLVKGMDKVGNASQTAGKKGKKAGEDIVEGMDKAKQKSEGLFSSLSQFGQAFIGIKAVAQSVAGAVSGVIGGIFEEGMSRQNAVSDFETLLGSKDEAVKYTKDLRKSAAATLYGTSTINENAKSMIAYGLDKDTALEMQNVIGDIAMGDKNKMNSLSMAFSQMSGLGKLQGQDWKQMIGAGFNPLTQMEKDLGKTQEELQDMMSKGQITAEMVKEAFVNATKEGGQYFNSMQGTIEGTLSGKLAVLQSNFDNLKAKLFDLLEPIANAILPVLTNKVLPAINKIVEKISPFLAETAAFLTGTLFPVMETIGKFIFDNIDVIGVFAGVILTVVGALKIWTAVQTILNAVMTANPIGLVVVAIAALVAIIYKVIDAWDSFGAALSVVLGPLGMIVNLIMTFKTHWDSIKEAFENDGILAGIKRIGIVMLDFILKPLMQILETVAKFTGWNWVDNLAKKVRSLRESLDLVTEGEKKVVVKTNAETAENGDNPNKELKDAVNKPGAATVPDLMKTTDKGTKAAVSGGQKNTTVNIHIQDMVKEINFNGTLQENEDDLVNRVSECMTRVLYATAQLE